MTKYTADDFANARFAEHPDGRVAARFGYPSTRPWESSNSSHSDSTMAERGWVPVPTKPTITESQFRPIASRLFKRWPDLGVFMSNLQHELSSLGIEIVNDPEPTNTDRLRELHRAWINECGDLTLSEYFDKHGVTAPNVKGN